MPRLSFGELLEIGGAPSPRGRGRGNARGAGRGGGGGRGGTGRGGGRGGGNARGGYAGRGGYGGGGRGGSFAADYTSVGVDYGKINAAANGRGGYRNDHEGVQPFGESSRGGSSNGGQRGRGSFGRGRGGRGGLGGLGFTPGGARPHLRDTAGSDSNTSTPASGTATPITGGLGFHTSTTVVRKARVTVRVDADGVETWGGGWAPLFIKAGELFKDGEVDVVKRDGDVLRVSVYPLNDPSAPQMLNLRDDREMEIEPGESAEAILGLVEHAHAAHVTQLEERIPASALRHEEGFCVDGDDSASEEELDLDDEDEQDVDLDLEADVMDADRPIISTLTTTTTTSVVFDDDDEIVELTEVTEVHSEEPDDTAALFFVDTAGARDPTDDTASSIDPAEDTHLFFVDTTADASTTNDDVPLYHSTSTAAPVGADTRAPTAKELKALEDEEAIVFKPKIFADPVPASASSSRPPQRSGFELTNVYVDPRVTLNRKDRKAVKKAKKLRSKKGKRSNGKEERFPRDDSDIEWGSDGPPGRRDIDRDVAALGHTLAGTDLDVDVDLDDEDVDPDIDMDAMARFAAGASGGIGFGGGEAMVEMESDSDQWEEPEDDEEEHKGRGRAARHQNDPFGLEISSEESEEDSDEDSEEDDDEELDETADFEALAAAYDSDSSDENDDDDEDTGIPAHLRTWKDDMAEDLDEDEDDEEDDEDEADWFARQVDDAVDKGVMSSTRKNRNAVFRSIHNGTFNDTTALPTAPVKKSKKGAHVPDELFDQWEKDRQKKADKKRQREMERLLGVLIGGGGGKKGGKGKKGKKAAAAARAHLVPASAAQVAELFDLSSDDDGGWGMTTRAMSKKGKEKAAVRASLLLPRTLEEVDEQVQEFMADSGRTTLALPAMDKEARKKVHMLAECYDLKSQSKGKGASRFPVLIKLARSGLRDDRVAKLERLIAASSATGGAFYKALYKRTGNGKKTGNPSNNATRGMGGGASARAREGELVGEGADKIGQDNVGHKLLSMMGWTEGSSIGRPGGLDVPIVAVVKNTKSGLGAY